MTSTIKEIFSKFFQDPDSHDPGWCADMELGNPHEPYQVLSQTGSARVPNFQFGNSSGFLVSGTPLSFSGKPPDPWKPLPLDFKDWSKEEIDNYLRKMVEQPVVKDWLKAQKELSHASSEHGVNMDI